MKEALQRLGRRELEREAARTSRALTVHTPHSQQPAGRGPPLFPLKVYRNQSYTSGDPKAHTHLRTEPLQAWQGDVKDQYYTYSLLAAPGPKAKGTSRPPKLTAGRRVFPTAAPGQQRGLREGFPTAAPGQQRGLGEGLAAPPVSTRPSCTGPLSAVLLNETHLLSHPNTYSKPTAKNTADVCHSSQGCQPVTPERTMSPKYSVSVCSLFWGWTGMPGILYQLPPSACWIQMDWREVFAQVFVFHC